MTRQTIIFPDGLIGICGDNGSGKSKLVEAISYALFGPRGTLPEGDTERDIRSAAAPEGARCVVELVFRVGTQEFRVERGPHGAALYIDGEPTPQVQTKSAVTARVQQLLRLSPITYRGTFVARQRDVAGLQSQSINDSQRLHLVNRLIGVAEVERAVVKAGEELRQRSAKLSTEKAAVLLSVAEARGQLGAIQGTLALAQQEADRSDENYRLAQQNTFSANANAAAMRERGTKADGIRNQIAEVAEQQRLLRDNQHRTLQRLREATSADEACRLAREQVAATSDAVQAVERQEQLQQIAQAENDLAEEQEKIRGPLATQAAERQRVEEQLRELSEPTAQLTSALTEWRAKATTAKTNAMHEYEKLEKARRVRDNAHQLGPDAPCEFCGAALGDRLDTVLTHFDQEIANAERLATSYDREADLARKTIDEMQRSQHELQQEAAALQGRLDNEYGLVYGELRSKQERVRELNEEIVRMRGLLPPDLRHAPYRVAYHQQAQARLARHREAEQILNAQAALAAQRATLEQTATGIEGDLTAAEKHVSELEGELGLVAISDEQLSGAVAEENEARQRQVEAEAALLSATGNVATARAELKQGENQLNAALDAEARVADAAYQVEVADRTKTLLEFLLASISNEARPRLTELMSEWVRPLLGRRFTEIELSNEYRLRANNGSGLHDLAHFSGGEQTALAIMLRAAISLFCRERAGFDTGFLVLDEVFGDQDATRRNLLVQFLEQIKGHYHQIIVVNHIEEVTGHFDTVLQVTMVGNESTITVQT